MSGYLKRGLLAGVAAAFLIAGTAVSVPAQSPGEVIKDRRALMKDNSANMKKVKAFLKGKAGTAADIAAAGNRLAANAARIAALYPKGTSAEDGVGKTRAKPAIWLKRADFETAATAMKTAGAKLAAAAGSGDMAAIKVAAGAMGKSCGGCHKPFRAPKKKK